MYGSIERYDAHLMAKRYTQKEGIDCDETFSPVIKMTLDHIILAIIYYIDLELCQMNVKTMFLNGDLVDSFV